MRFGNATNEGGPRSKAWEIPEKVTTRFATSSAQLGADLGAPPFPKNEGTLPRSDRLPASKTPSALGALFGVLRFGGADGLPGVRDTNQDGRHSPEEWAASKARGDRLHEVLFHPGHDLGDGRALVNSVGCWNVEDYDAFVSALGGPSARFNVTLVNALRPE